VTYPPPQGSIWSSESSRDTQEIGTAMRTVFKASPPKQIADKISRLVPTHPNSLPARQLRPKRPFFPLFPGLSRLFSLVLTPALLFAVRGARRFGVRSPGTAFTAVGFRAKARVVQERQKPKRRQVAALQSRFAATAVRCWPCRSQISNRQAKIENSLPAVRSALRTPHSAFSLPPCHFGSLGPTDAWSRADGKGRNAHADA